MNYCWNAIFICFVSRIEKASFELGSLGHYFSNILIKFIMIKMLYCVHMNLNLWYDLPWLIITRPFHARVRINSSSRSGSLL